MSVAAAACSPVGRALATRNNNVYTASLQCFGIISKGCNVFILGQITEKK